MKYDGIDFLIAEGWQNEDDQHRIGTGVPGYRLVYKTLRLVPLPGINLQWPNLKIRIEVDEVSKGGIRAKGALQSRHPDKKLLVDSIEVKEVKGKTTVNAIPNMRYEYEIWDKKLPNSGIVEVLIHTEAKDLASILREGRKRTSRIKTLLELAIGERLLGVPFAEEVVEIFPDWHWNRRVASTSVGSESQLDVRDLGTKKAVETIKAGMEATQKLSEAERERLTIASEWYWKADGEADLVNAFISTWIAIEALEMPESTKIQPVIDRLVSLTNQKPETWKDIVGRLYGLRGALVHGNKSDLSEDKLELLSAILKVLLEARMFERDNSQLREELLVKAGLNSDNAQKP